jgi:uncharacterized protein (DUF362 family)
MALTNEVIDLLDRQASAGWTRRKLLTVLSPAVTAILPRRLLAAGPYRVGIGRDANAYAATVRAIDASGEWPLLGVAGKVAIVKPNLVGKRGAQTGATTDPEVVRAVVDRLLADGAQYVLIVETSPTGAYFFECGYDFFRTYDPQNRVALADLNSLPSVLAQINGWIYTSIWAPALILRRDFLFINVAKLKTHAESLATLCVKNTFGIPDVDRYISTPAAGRFAMHDRGLNQAIPDVYHLRPADFCVIDGIVGMEGLGPLSGAPVQMNTVIAGRNAVAVDRTGLHIMDIPQIAVRYLYYMSQWGVGPHDMQNVTLAGDAPLVRRFILPPTPPSYDPPRLSVSQFSPGNGQSVTGSIRYYQPCYRTVRILKLNDQDTTVEVIRTLASQQYRAPGSEDVVWDGRKDDTTIAPPGRYAFHVSAKEVMMIIRHGDALSWINVL